MQVRVACDAASAGLLGRGEFGVMKERVMSAYGNLFCENGAQEIEYYSHTGGANYAYVPVTKI